jgi:hypothetical protein
VLVAMWVVGGLLGYSTVGNLVYRELERRNGRPFHGILERDMPTLAAALWPFTIFVLAPRWTLLTLDTWRTSRRERLRLERAARETPTTKGAYR